MFFPSRASFSAGTYFDGVDIDDYKFVCCAFVCLFLQASFHGRFFNIILTNNPLIADSVLHIAAVIVKTWQNAPFSLVSVRISVLDLFFAWLPNSQMEIMNRKQDERGIFWVAEYCFERRTRSLETNPTVALSGKKEV